MNTVLITGAAGFAGSHLLEHLSQTHDLVAWSRADPPPGLAPLARWQRVNLLDRRSVRETVRHVRPAAVVHLAGFPYVAESWSNTSDPLALNVLATHYLFDALRESSPGCRVVVAGSAMLYAPSPKPHTEDDQIAPDSPYGLSKLAQEQLTIRARLEDGLATIATRSFNHTGPRQKPAFVAPSMARQIALIERGDAEPVIRVGNLDAKRDFTDVRDVVRAYAALLDRGTAGSIYNVASGVGRSIRSLLDGLIARARVEVTVETDPARMRPHDVPDVVGDATKLTKATGWTPQISFDQTLDDLLEYWRRQP
jgi:GDP-4-dehydro-6-deoxy-D-mannose reductase